MKTMMIYENGSALVDVHRKFLVEVPDDCDKEQAMELLEQMESHTHLEGAEWADDDGRHWIGYDMEIVDTHVRELDTVDRRQPIVGLKVIRLTGPLPQ